MFGAGENDDPSEACELELQHASAERRETVVSAPLLLRATLSQSADPSRRARDLFDQAGVEHPLNRPVQCARSHSDLSLGHRLDLLGDGVAMPASRSCPLGIGATMTVGQREEDVEDDRGEREKLPRIGRTLRGH